MTPFSPCHPGRQLNDFVGSEKRTTGTRRGSERELVLVTRKVKHDAWMTDPVLEDAAQA